MAGKLSNAEGNRQTGDQGEDDCEWQSSRRKTSLDDNGEGHGRSGGHVGDGLEENLPQSDRIAC